MRSIVRAGALVGALVAVLLSSTQIDGAAATPSGPCGTLTGTAHYTHIVVIMDENVSYATLHASTQAPYLTQLTQQCGSENDMHAATHPSQPNYMALTSGIASAATTHTANDNVFHQSQVAGKTWASYEESMPSNCAGNKGFYGTAHNPAFWYTDLRSPSNTCALDDKPMSPALDTAIANDALPSFSWITPNYCNDMHWESGCPLGEDQRIAAGDTWLSQLIPRLTAMNSYTSGKTLIVITWDEGDGKETTGDCTDPKVYSKQPSCQIATIVLSPYITPGAVDASDHNLYGLLGDFEDILGYPRLGRAVGQASLRPGLGF